MKQLRSILCFSAAFLCILFTLTACGETNKAEQTVTGLLNALQSNNMQEAMNYGNIYEIQPTSSKQSSEIIMNHLLDKFSYQIISSEKINRKTVMVKITLTNINMMSVMDLYYNKLSTLYAQMDAAGEEELSNAQIQEKIDQLFSECVNQPGLDTISNTVDVKVEKEGGHWFVIPDDAFRDALYGRIISASKQLKGNE